MVDPLTVSLVAIAFQRVFFFLEQNVDHCDYVQIKGAGQFDGAKYYEHFGGPVKEKYVFD